MEEKKCSKCLETKSVSEFHRRKDKWQPYCKPCMKVRNKEYWDENGGLTPHRAQLRKNYRRSIQQQVFDYLKEHPCVDCGEADPVVLEFDHREQRDKLGTISRMAIRGTAWKKVKEEIDKCDVRCANCHRRRTAKQLGWKILEFI